MCAASADIVLPLIPEKLLVVPSRLVVTLALALAVSPLCFVSSLDATSVLSVTWISVASYACWMACTVYAHAKGILELTSRGESLGLLWQGLSTSLYTLLTDTISNIFTGIVAFTFTTSSTLPLYAALKGTYQPGIPKPKRSRSFKLLSALSIIIAVSLVLPPTIFRSNASEVSVPPINQNYTTVPTSQLQLQDTRTAPLPFKAFMASLAVLTLVLGIPSIIITAPPLPIPLAIRRNTNFPVSRAALYIIAVALSILPAWLCRMTNDALLLLAFLSTYAVPGDHICPSFHFES